MKEGRKEGRKKKNRECFFPFVFKRRKEGKKEERRKRRKVGREEVGRKAENFFSSCF